MSYYAFFNGIMIALIAGTVFMAIRLWAKTSLERWGYDLTRETHSQLRDTHLKLDSLKYQNERLFSALERLERTAGALTKTLNDLHSRLSGPKSTV